jgi:hypothetical protein
VLEFLYPPGRTFHFIEINDDGDDDDDEPIESGPPPLPEAVP